MTVLGIDTSSDACSVALSVGERVAERHAVRPREHSRLLLPMINEVLAECGVSTSDLDAVVLGNGPGSFIGLRIAAAVAQGLCYGSGAELVPVSSLAAIAAEAFDDPSVTTVLVAQDAHMTEVYLAAFAADADGMPRELAPVRLHPAAAIDGLDGSALAAGAGWDRYPALWEANRERLAGRLAIDHPRATRLILLGQRARAAGGAVDPERLEPAYVREQVAMPPARNPSSSNGNTP